MAALRAVAVAAFLSIALLAIAGAPAQAADIDCGGQTVEICIPVCVTEPCPAYVCVHPPRGLPDTCRDL